MPEQKSFSEPANKAQIAELIAANAYDAKIMPELEAYVDAQVKANAYDFDANRHLLQQYKNSPDSAKTDFVEKILLLALLQLPQKHFLACTYLLSSKLREEDTVKRLLKLHSLLQVGQFKKFWAEVSDAKTRAVVDKVPNFDSFVRRFMASAVADTYQSIPVKVLSEHVNLSDKALDSWVAELGWTQATAAGVKVVTIPGEGLAPRTSRTEKIPLNDISSLFMNMTRS